MTGYTADLYYGKKTVTFEQFAMECARAFGALVTMRDDAKDAEIPEALVPSPYYSKRFNELMAALTTVTAMSDEETEKAAFNEYDSEIAKQIEYANERLAVKKRYEAMIADVYAWTPPTEDHEGLKTFMIDQLLSSVGSDCREYGADVKRLAGKEWRTAKLEKLGEEMARAGREMRAEEERTRDRNEWIQALRDSLKVTA
jgi:hypothetical protein